MQSSRDLRYAVARVQPPPSQSNTAPIRVLITDDHPLVLDGLSLLLQAYPDFEIVGRCSTGLQTVEAARRLGPDIVLLDLKLPDVDGLDVVRQLHGDNSTAKVVLLTAQINEDQLIEALGLGVRGVVLKEMATKLLVQCLHRVQAGGQWLEKESASRAMTKLVRREAKARELAALLTPREMEIVRAVAQGRTNKEIGAALFIAEGTVKIHLHNVYEKTKVNRRAELVRFAQEYGLA